MRMVSPPCDGFDEYLVRWKLERDGDVIVTATSRLLPVRRAGRTAMLKIALVLEEERGGRLMAWWRGSGAARVLDRDGNALLLERAQGERSLVDIACRGGDDEASRIICAVVRDLHASRIENPPELIPLARWFGDLESGAKRYGSNLLARCAHVGRELLAAQQDVVVLHGDIHHGNILDFGPRGWLAIDPKGLIGERGFEFANVFCNPRRDIVLSSGRLHRQLDIIEKAAGLNRIRLLKWILAYAGLSAIWRLDDGVDIELDLAVASIAAAELPS